MLDFTWKVFCMTGSVDTYLLMKEMEDKDMDAQIMEMDEGMNQADPVEISDDFNE